MWSLTTVSLRILKLQGLAWAHRDVVPPELAKPHRFDMSPEIHKHWAECAVSSCGFKFPCLSGMRAAHSHPYNRNHKTTSIAAKRAALGCCSPWGMWGATGPEWDPTGVKCWGRQPAAGLGMLHSRGIASLNIFGFWVHLLEPLCRQQLKNN